MKTPANRRDETIARIRKSLKRRSSKVWSVKGGTGTAWGWITIDAPPRSQTAQYVKDENAPEAPESYYEVDTKQPSGHTPKVLRDELASLLGLDSVHHQGVSIPANGDYYAEYIDRAEGREPAVCGEPYWD